MSVFSRDEANDANKAMSRGSVYNSHERDSHSSGRNMKRYLITAGSGVYIPADSAATGGGGSWKTSGRATRKSSRDERGRPDQSNSDLSDKTSAADLRILNLFDTDYL